MSLFKQLLTDLKDAAEEISTTLAADLSDARSVVGGEVGEAAEEINAALLARQGGWDTEITDHHQSLDAAVHEALVSKLTPQAGAALVRVEGVLARLQQARPDQPPVSAVVLKWDAPNAMVLFSHRVYVSTALLDALPSDDALAFVLGHELTHIDRGDIRLDGSLSRRLPPLPPMLPLRYSLGMLARTWMRPDMERAADAGGQALAVAAGYRADGFEAAFDVLSTQEGVTTEAESSEWVEFWRQKATGYPSITERRLLLRG